jgi:hypothetical protein
MQRLGPSLCALGVALALLLGTSGDPATARTRSSSKRGAHPVKKADSKDKGGRTATVGKRSSGRSSGRSGGRSDRRGGKRRVHYAPPQLPQMLELVDLDLMTGYAHVIATGTTRVPDARLFVLSDDRGRRFVPELAECTAPPGVEVPAAALQPDELEGDGGGEGTGGASEAGARPPEQPVAALAPINTRWRCTLTLSRLYRRAPLVGVAMEWGTRFVEVPAGQVAAVWQKARAAAPDHAVAQSPGPRVPPPRPLLPDPPSLGAEDPAEEEAPAEPDGKVGATVE